MFAVAATSYGKRQSAMSTFHCLRKYPKAPNTTRISIPRTANCPCIPLSNGIRYGVGIFVMTRTFVFMYAQPRLHLVRERTQTGIGAVLHSGGPAPAGRSLQSSPTES